MLVVLWFEEFAASHDEDREQEATSAPNIGHSMKLWIEEINEGVETEEEKLEEGASLVLIVYDARFDRILNVRGSGDGGGGGEEGGGEG